MKTQIVMMAGLVGVAGMVWLAVRPAKHESAKHLQVSQTARSDAQKSTRPQSVGLSSSQQSANALLAATDNAIPAAGTNEIVPAVQGSRIPKTRQPKALSRSTVSNQLAAKDPHKALEDVMKIQDPAQRLKALLAYSTQLATINPEGAGRELLSNAAGEERRRALSQLAGGWSSLDPEAALNWFHKNVNDADLLRAGRESIYSTWAKTDPIDAARNILDTNPDSTTLAVVMSTWTRSNLPEVVDWFHKDLSADQQNALRETLIVLAGSKDEDAARALFNEMPASAAKWEAARRLATTLASSNLGLANEFAGSLPADSGREDLLRRVQRHSPGGDPLSASTAQAIRPTPAGGVNH